MRVNFPAVRLIAERTPVARKEYRCAACGETIPCGSPHVLFVYRECAALDQRHALHAVRIHSQRCPEVANG